MYKVVKYYLLNLWRILRTSVCGLEIYKVGIARRRKCKSAVCILISITSTSIGVQRCSIVARERVSAFTGKQTLIPRENTVIEWKRNRLSLRPLYYQQRRNHALSRYRVSLATISNANHPRFLFPSFTVEHDTNGVSIVFAPRRVIRFNALDKHGIDRRIARLDSGKCTLRRKIDGTTRHYPRPRSFTTV